MDRAHELKAHLSALLPPGESTPALNAWAHRFRQEQAAITSEAHAVLNGGDPARLGVMVRKAECWPAMAATCAVGLQLIEWAHAKGDTNNKAAH
jgi:hypothetical protein